MNKYVFTGTEGREDHYDCIFESDLDLATIHKLLCVKLIPIIRTTNCNTYIRMGNDTFIFITPHVLRFYLGTYDDWLLRHEHRPDDLELGVQYDYKVIDLEGESHVSR